MSTNQKEEPKLSEQGQLYVDLKKAQKQINLLKNQLKAAQSGEKSVKSATNQATEPTNQAQIEVPAVKSDHDGRLKPWQAGCTTCGEKNPEYRAETKCVACNGTTGAVEVAKKLDFCPHCNVKLKFAAVSEEGKRKIAEMFPTRGPM